VVSRRTPVARVCQACCAGQNALIPCRHVPEPAGNSTRRWDALRITARRRRTLTSGPRAGRRVSMATGQELVRRPGNPVQREPGLPPELALGGDRGPIRVVWTTQEPDTHASRSGETPLRGAEALEAMPPSTAVPKRCRGARLLGFRAAEAAASTSGISSDRLRARPAEAGRGRVVGVTVHRGGWPSRRCRSRLAEARFELLPIAACRSRLTFGGVDLSGLRGDRARRLPACPGSTREAGMPTGH
jgi:hypothetical protein